MEELLQGLGWSPWAWLLTWAWWAVLGVVAVSSGSLLLYTAFLRYANLNSITFCKATDRMEGKTVIVTANKAESIGVEVARDLAGRGARVILGCPDLEEAQKVAARIGSVYGHGRIEGHQLDTSSLASVTVFANIILKTEDRLDVLVLAANTAGRTVKTTTEDNLETTMATNHFGHFLLVNLLIGLLNRSRPSRVVVLASSAHYLLSSVKPNDLNFSNVAYGGLRAYAQSALCNLLMTNYLAHLTQGSGVVVNSGCPGHVWTEPFLQGQGVLVALYNTVLYCVARTPLEGAQTLITLAVSEEADKVTGAFYTDCSEKEMSELALNTGLAKKVWEECEAVVRLMPGQ